MAPFDICLLHPNCCLLQRFVTNDGTLASGWYVGPTEGNSWLSRSGVWVVQKQCQDKLEEAQKECRDAQEALKEKVRNGPRVENKEGTVVRCICGGGRRCADA